MILLAFIAGAFLNRVRGGFLNVPRWLALFLLGEAYALLCLYCGVSYLYAILSGALLVLGIIPSFGSIWSAIGDWFEGVYKAPKPILWACKRLEGRVRLWGWCAGFLRGAYLIPACALPCGPPGVLIALSMPICYWLGIMFERVVLKRSGVEAAEVIFGAVIFGASYGVLHDG